MNPMEKFTFIMLVAGFGVPCAYLIFRVAAYRWRACGWYKKLYGHHESRYLRMGGCVRREVTISSGWLDTPNPTPLVLDARGGLSTRFNTPGTTPLGGRRNEDGTFTYVEDIEDPERKITVDEELY